VVAVRSGELVRTAVGDQHAAGLVDLLAHRQRFRRQQRTGEQLDALLFHRLLHPPHRDRGLGLGVQHAVGQLAAEHRALLLDGEPHAEFAVLADRREHAGHGGRAGERQGLALRDREHRGRGQAGCGGHLEELSSGRHACLLASR